MKTVTISAAKTRNNLSRILSEAYFSGTIFLVTKNNKVMAEIKKPADIDIEERMRNFARVVGTLSKEDATIIKKSIKKNDELPTRTTPIKSLNTKEM